MVAGIYARKSNTHDVADEEKRIYPFTGTATLGNVLEGLVPSERKQALPLGMARPGWPNTNAKTERPRQSRVNLRSSQACRTPEFCWNLCPDAR